MLPLEIQICYFCVGNKAACFIFFMCDNYWGQCFIRELFLIKSVWFRLYSLCSAMRGGGGAEIYFVRMYDERKRKLRI